MRKIPWSLVFVSASFVALGMLALLPQPQVVGTDATPAATDLALPTLPADGWRPVVTETVVSATPTRKMQIQLQFVDQHGAAIADVQVGGDHLTAFSIGHIFDGRSNATGSFTSPELVKGTYELQLSHPEFLAIEPLELHLPEDARQVHEVRLTRGCVVEGHLLGGDGIPRNHGSLLLKKNEGEQLLELKPDADGGFRFPAVSEGQWTISWYTNRQLVQDPRLSYTLLCTTGQSSKLQITIPTADLRALNSGETMDVGIQELADPSTASPAPEL